MVKKILSSVLLFLSFTFLYSQEIATFMTYNLLNYRNETSFCTNNNNNPISKENYIKTIVDHVQPDLIAFNEVGSNPSNAVKLLDRCLNVNGESKYMMANFSSTSGSSLANAFYYNGDMFEMYSYDKIENEVGGSQIVRLINVYTVYYKDANLTLGADTTFLTVFIAHLKAGTGSANSTQRDKATEAVMEYISDENISGNYIITGDFNTYKSSEAAIQNLVDPSNQAIKFLDPVNRMGSWNNNSAYADVHTQSTHYSSNGCASGGGLDDRFDFILMSQAIKDDTDHIDYVKNSYKALANDGNHFNQSINNPANNSVPVNVLDAIYNGSDHLPVLMDMIMSPADPNSVSLIDEKAALVKVISPTSGKVSGELVGPAGVYTIKVYNITGALEAERVISNKSTTAFSIPLSTKGIHLVQVTSENGFHKTIKVVLK